jgi:hypothetical protein
MVDFLKKRLQVFVSSTFSDLKEERQAAVEAILAAGHIPAGMELFAAGDESQVEVIKQWIDESDVYLLILGGRYGSVEPKTGKSYTQLEYEYAIELQKPFFACVIKDPLQEARVKALGPSVIETENPQQLKTLRAEVLTRMVKFWEDTKDIKIAIAEKLSEFARRDDLVGWVRPSHINVAALTNETARLSRENSELRTVLSERRDPNSASFEEMKRILEFKGALQVLVAARTQLSQWGISKPAPDQASIIAELTALGLLTYNWDNGMQPRYQLAQRGYDFLNRLEVERLQNNQQLVSDGQG